LENTGMETSRRECLQAERVGGKHAFEGYFEAFWVL
jgi:hypothetical protein